MSNTRQVTIGAVPHEMSIVDGGVLFSSKSGFYGVTGRYMFEYKSNLWYLTDTESTWSRVPVCHLVKMYTLLEEHIGGDHFEADGSKFELRFKS